MTLIVTRTAYFETGIEVLSDKGYGGLKLAEVCRRLGVTSGSFYHYFTNWSTYTRELIDYWLQERTRLRAELIGTDSDPRRRLEALLRGGVEMEHSAEAAIRVWSAIDPQVRIAQTKLDQQRFDAIYAAAMELLHNERQAQVFAECALYTVIGYEQATLPRDGAALAWIGGQLLNALDSGQFADVPAS